MTDSAPAVVIGGGGKKIDTTPLRGRRIVCSLFSPGDDSARRKATTMTDLHDDFDFSMLDLPTAPRDPAKAERRRAQSDAAATAYTMATIQGADIETAKRAAAKAAEAAK